MLRGQLASEIVGREYAGHFKRSQRDDAPAPLSIRWILIDPRSSDAAEIGDQRRDVAGCDFKSFVACVRVKNALSDGTWLLGGLTRGNCRSRGGGRQKRDEDSPYARPHVGSLYFRIEFNSAASRAPAR